MRFVFCAGLIRGVSLSLFCGRVFVVDLNVGGGEWPVFFVRHSLIYVCSDKTVMVGTEAGAGGRGPHMRWSNG